MPVIYETLLVGILLAVLFTELTDVFPGGIIVPGYMALYLDQPMRLLVTILAAVLSLITYRLLSRYLILFGRRRFVMMVFLGVLWAELLFLLVPRLFSFSLEIRAVGWLIPGLLANNLEKQKFFLTLAAMFVVSVMTYFFVRILVVI